MYVAVKGGERAIDNAHAWLAEERRGDLQAELTRLEQAKHKQAGTDYQLHEKVETMHETLSI